MEKTISAELSSALEALKASMKAGTTEFSYRKKDGSIREAVGTLCPNLMPKPMELSLAEAQPKKPKAKSQDVFCYYDLTEGKVGWRSFRKEDFLG